RRGPLDLANLYASRTNRATVQKLLQYVNGRHRKLAAPGPVRDIDEYPPHRRWSRHSHEHQRSVWSQPHSWIRAGVSRLDRPVGEVMDLTSRSTFESDFSSSPRLAMGTIASDYPLRLQSPAVGERGHHIGFTLLEPDELRVPFDRDTKLGQAIAEDALQT